MPLDRFNDLHGQDHDFQQQREIVARLIRERGGSLAALDALGEEFPDLWLTYPGKKPVYGPESRAEMRWEISRRLAQYAPKAVDTLAGCDAFGVRTGPCFLPREATEWLVYTMYWRDGAASPWVTVEQKIRQANRGRLRGEFSAANKPAGKLRAVATLIDEAASAIEGIEPAYGLRIRAKHPPIEADAVERQAVWFEQFNPDDDPFYFNYLGVRQEGAPKALARQSVIGSAALVLHGIIGDALAQTEIDRIVDALAGAVFPGGSRPGVQEVRRWRLTFAEMRGVA